MIGESSSSMSYPYAERGYDALEHFSLEDRAHPDDDPVELVPTRHEARHYFSQIRNFDAVARNRFDAWQNPNFEGGWNSAMGPNFRGVAPKNYRRSDQRLREDVCDRLYEDDYIDASQVEVSVSGGVVELCGSVADKLQKYRAQFLASSVRGVDDVINRIAIETYDLSEDIA